MVAERRFQTVREDASVDGTSGTMTATGQLLYFPGWEAIRAMDPAEVKRWILSKENEQAQYLSVVAASGGSHRGARNCPARSAFGSSTTSTSCRR